MAYSKIFETLASKKAIFGLVFFVYALSYLYTINHIYEAIIPPVGSDPYVYDLISDLVSKDFWLKKFDSYFLSPVYLYYFSFLKIFISNTITFFKTVILFNYIIFFVSGIFFYNLIKLYSDNQTVLNVSYLIFALNPVSIFYSSIPVKDVLAVSLFTIFLYLIVNYPNKKFYLILSGLISGVILGLRGNFAIIILITIIFITLKTKKVTHPILYLICTFLILSPFAPRNYLISGNLTITYSGSGIHFYIANNDKSNGTYTKLTDIRNNALGHYFDAKTKAESYLQKSLTDSEVNNFYKVKGVEFIKNNPIKFIKLFFNKLLYFLSFKEISNNYNYDFFKNNYTNFKILGFTFINFGTLIVFGITGLLGFSYQNKKLILSFFFSLMAVNLIIFITGRYRFIVFPILHMGIPILLKNITKLKLHHYTMFVLLSFLTFFSVKPPENIENARIKSSYSLRQYFFQLKDKDYLKIYKENQIKYLRNFTDKY